MRFAIPVSTIYAAYNPGYWDYSAGIERQASRRRSNDDALRLLGLPWLHPAMEWGGCVG